MKKANIQWKVGILPTGDCFISFANGEQHFECTMTEDTCVEIGKALQETGDLRKKGHGPTIANPSLVPMKKGGVN